MRISILLLLGCLVLSSCSEENASPPAAANPSPSQPDFSEWMGKDQLSQYFSSLQKEHGDRIWVTAVEGRWYRGWAEYRLAYAMKPTGFHCAWYWWYNQPLDRTSSRITQYGDQDFQLVYFQKFERPDGVERYQTVWHKMVPVREPQSKY
jgi:hypothetical protein